jgi:hypothetical protein
MSACAGSSTDASRPSWVQMSSRKFTSLPGMEQLRIALDRERRMFSSNSPAWSRWIAPGRIGFMSTQRGEDHLRLAHCKNRLEISGGSFPASLSRRRLAIAAGRTAPPGTPGRAATNSLISDHCNQQPVRLLQPGRPPIGQAAALSPTRQLQFGSPPIPSYAIEARVHRTSPWVRSALRCRTERYDGKGNLHFQHAA